jgi:hypothetical protein
LREIMKGSGRGYYRPPTLLSLWTQAPFLHNNAVGPEVCGKPSRKDVDFYSSPYVDQNDAPMANPPPCVPFDPSVEGRYKLYKDSMQDLLNPARRLRKVTITDEDIVIDVAPDFKLGGVEGGFAIVLPKGKSAGARPGDDVLGTAKGEGAQPHRQSAVRDAIRQLPA